MLCILFNSNKSVHELYFLKGPCHENKFREKNKVMFSICDAFLLIDSLYEIEWLGTNALPTFYRYYICVSAILHFFYPYAADVIT